MTELVKCHAGHETVHSLWDCPVCVLKSNDEAEKKIEILTKALENSKKKYKSLYRLCGLYSSKLDILVKLEILHEFIDTSNPEKASAKIKELK